MPVQITRMDGEPIVHCLVTGDVTAAEIAEMFARCAELADDVPGRVYRITEIRDITVRFYDVMIILKQMSDGRPGSTTDPRFFGVMVGTDEMVELVASSSHQEQYGRMNVPLFCCLDDALDFVREKMAAESAA
jgi:hypothetical protein